LDDVKAVNQSENNAARTIALDHLGTIAARIRASTLKFEKASKDGGHSWTDLKTMDEVTPSLRTLSEAQHLCQILASASSKELEKLLSAHRSILGHLSKRSSEDQAYDVIND
jgi:cohesin loading factor subunit SCC2